MNSTFFRTGSTSIVTFVALTTLSGTFNGPARGAAYDHGDPSALEQLLLERMNRARANPGAEATRLGVGLNDDVPAEQPPITDTPKQPIAFNSLLIQAARAHSEWMRETGVLSSIGENNTDPLQRMEAAGYQFTGSPAGGNENIASRASVDEPDLVEFATSFHDAWFSTAQYRYNLLLPEFDEVGIGLVAGRSEIPLVEGQEPVERNALVGTQDFARSSFSPGPLVVGVVYDDLNGSGLYDVGEGVAGVEVMPAEGDFHAVTSASGGYAFPYSGTGSLAVTFSAGGLAGPVVLSVQRTGENVKLDLKSNTILPLSIQSGSVMKSASAFDFDFTGTPGAPVTVQRSDDFSEWTDLETFILDGAPQSFSDEAPVGDTPWFYRLRGGE